MNNIYIFEMLLLLSDLLNFRQRRQQQAVQLQQLNSIFFSKEIQKKL